MPRDIILRPFTPDDVPFAWQLACDPEVGPRWRYSGHIPAFEVFAEELWRDVVSHQIICRRANGIPLGVVTIYGANFANGYAHLAVASRSGGWGVGAIAALLALRYSFKTWPVRKIYFETHSGNLPQFESALGKVFDLEARIPCHQWFQGVWVDKIVLATYQHHLSQYVEPTLSGLGLVSVE